MISSRSFLRFLLLALVAAGCGGKKQENDGAVHVRLAIGGQGQMVYLPATLAERLGFYRAEGLDVVTQDFPGGSKALESEVPMWSAGSTTTRFRWRPKDGKCRLLWPCCAIRGSFSQFRRLRHIEKIEDLKGAVAGVTAAGSSSNMILNYLLVKHGSSAQDVSATGIGATATAVAAMERGKVDAAILFDPAITQLSKRVSKVSVLEDTRSVWSGYLG